MTVIMVDGLHKRVMLGRKAEHPQRRSLQNTMQTLEPRAGARDDRTAEAF
jgi:hypothetical protein